MKQDALFIGGVFLAGAAVAALSGVLLVRWAVNKVLP